MLLRLLFLFGLSALLFGCSNDQVKENAPPAMVEERANKVSEPEQNVTAQSYPTDNNSNPFYELTDPESPLAIRVIYFDYNSHDIQPEYRKTIEAHADYLNQSPDTTITLEGHADERGSREYNLALGESRALSVKQQLLILGVSSSQVKLVSYGEERPAIYEHNEAAWQKNRRVEILY